MNNSGFLMNENTSIAMTEDIVVPENKCCEYIDCGLLATLTFLGRKYCSLHYTLEYNRNNPNHIIETEKKRIKGLDE
jgi:hypothetical protein